MCCDRKVREGGYRGRGHLKTIVDVHARSQGGGHEVPGDSKRENKQTRVLE